MAKNGRITLFTNSVCNLSCSECIMKFQMTKEYEGRVHNDWKYQMSIQEVKDFVYFSEASNYVFDIVLSGGEPMLWKNLEEGLKILRKSSCVNRIIMFSNGMQYKRMNQNIVNMLDRIRFSIYKDVEGGSNNTKHIKEFESLYSKNSEIISVDRSHFFPNPKKPLEIYEPVKCMNPERMFYKGQIYACPHSGSLAAHAQSNVKVSEKIGLNFLQGTGDIRKNHEKEICSLCISNKTVRDQVKRKFNKNKK